MLDEPPEDKKSDVWKSFLNLDHKIFKNKHYQFYNQIQTDGISCGLVFIRRDLKDRKWGSKVPVLQEQEFYKIKDLSKEQLDTLKERNIVGCDPGKRNLVYMMDEKGKNYDTQPFKENRESKAKLNQHIYYGRKRKRKMILLKKKQNYPLKIVKRLITKSSKHI